MITGLPKAKIFGSRGTSTAERRTGLVHGNGRCFVDDAGMFHPLGTTLFWAPIGYRSEREHLDANLQWLSGRVDYIRILGEVGWPGREIDPAWPEYDELMKGLIDHAYDDYGLRVEPSIIGGGTSTDPVALARRWVGIVRGREQKIMHFEDANEMHADENAMRQMSAILRSGTPNLVAPSSPTGGDVDIVKRMMSQSNTVATGHFDRSDGDFTAGASWREVRQTWDWRDFDFLCSHNEGKGPRSSIAEQTNPYVLAMMRAVGIMNGVDAFVLHTGPGVTGVLDPPRNRPPNIYELPDIERIFSAVKTAGGLMPADCAGWQKFNGHWQGHPFPADQVWTDAGNGDHGCIRTYGAVRDGRFVTTPHGIKNFVNMRAINACVIEAYDPTDGNVIHSAEMSAGQTLTLNGPERGGIPAYIIVGQNR